LTGLAFPDLDIRFVIDEQHPDRHSVPPLPTAIWGWNRPSLSDVGASDGTPRQEIDPWLQLRDYSDAITFARSLEQTDSERTAV